MLHPPNRIISMRGISLRKKSNNQINQVLSSINLDIQRGEIVGLIDFTSDSASSLLRVIAGLIMPSSGTGYVNTYPMNHDKAKSVQVSLYINIESSNFFSYTHQTVTDTIETLSNYCSISQKNFENSVKECEKKLKLDYSEFDVQYDDLQPLNRFKAHLMLALITKPIIVYIDQCYLDLIADRKVFSNYIEILHSQINPTIIIADQYFTRIENYCDRIFVLKNGILFGVGSPFFWHKKIEQHPMITLTCQKTSKLKIALQNRFKNIRLEEHTEKNSLTLILHNEEEIKTLIDFLNDSKYRIYSYKRIIPLFEDIFKRYVQKNDPLG